MHTPVDNAIRHFLDLSDYDGEALRALLNHAASLKADSQSGGNAPLLQGKTLAMLFEQRSTRTRVSFELGMVQLGGYALELGANSSQISRGESIADTARVLSRYVDMLMYRAHSHASLLEMANAATVPVINGLTNWSHPCQALADILTFEEHKGSIVGRKLAWVGDASNVAVSLAHAAILLGFDFHIACPTLGKPPAELMDWVKENKKPRHGSVRVLSDPEKAVEHADAVLTDTWVSMGDEAEAAKRKAALEKYQVTEKLMKKAAEGAIFMHCLPAHRGEEVEAEVIDGSASAVWDEAENRLHIQKAIMLWCAHRAERAAPQKKLTIE